MPTSKRALLLALVAIVAVSTADAEKPIRKPQESFAPYWTSEPGWDTELQLKNNLASGPLTVTPVLRVASGEEIPLDPVTIPSNVSVSVWVNEGLLKHSPSLLSQPGSYGSVVFRFNSLSAGNLYAAVIVALHGGPIGFRVDASPIADSGLSPRAALGGSRDGIWWQPHAMQNDLLVFTNRSEKTLAGTLWLSDAAGKRWGQRLSLAARQTVRLNVHDLISTASLSGQYGGIQFEVPANAGALDSVHLTYDETAKSSASLTMFSRYPGLTPPQRPGLEGKPWTSYAPMLALRTPDAVLGLPSGTVLEPTILVRNATAKPVAASITLNWHGDSVRGQVKLADLNIAPFATQQLQIGDMQKQLGIPDAAHWALVTLSTPASPTDLIALASSYDASGRYNLDTPFSSNVAGHFAGGEWRADADHNQIMAVTNTGMKATSALLTLHYDNGEKTYEMWQAIQPGDQMWVNVASLIRNRVLDRKGNVLPADASFGTYDLQDLSPGLGSLTQGNLAVDNTFGFQVQPPYPRCCPSTNPGWSPCVFDVVIDGTDFGEIAGYDSCTGDLVDISSDFNDSWSANPAIATVTTRTVKGVAAGTTTASASGWVLEEGCITVPVQVNAPVYVQVPTYFGPTGYASTGCDCGPNSAGTCIAVSDQVLDQYGNAMQAAGITPQESICTGGSCQSGYHNFSNPVTTGTSGTYTDTPIGSCFSPVPSKNICVAATVSYQALFNGQTDPISTLASGTDCVQGVKFQIYGNPTAYNQTYTAGTLP